MLAVGVLEITVILKRDSDVGWDFEMEPWKDCCCSRREASAELGNQDRSHWTSEQIVYP